jgi:hypothetical protein
VLGVLLGEAALFGSLSLLIYFFAALLLNMIYIPLSEEPGLQRRFGDEYTAYSQRAALGSLPWTGRVNTSNHGRTRDVQSTEPPRWHGWRICLIFLPGQQGEAVRSHQPEVMIPDAVGSLAVQAAVAAHVDGRFFALKKRHSPGWRARSYAATRWP